MNRWFDCNFNYNKHSTNAQNLSFRCSTPEIMHSVKLPKLVHCTFNLNVTLPTLEIILPTFRDLRRPSWKQAGQ